MLLVIPFLQWLGGGGHKRARTVVLIIVPLLAGVFVYFQFLPSTKPPVESRVQHPPMPAKYQNLSNPFRNPSDEAVKTFINEQAFADISVSEARKQLVAKHTNEGYLLYQKNCSHCHGVLANGSGLMARGLRLKPMNFTDPGTIATLSEPYVFWRIKEGGLGLPPEANPWDSAMPAWGNALADEDIWKIILAVYDTAGVEPKQASAK